MQNFVLLHMQNDKDKNNFFSGGKIKITKKM